MSASTPSSISQPAAQIMESNLDRFPPSRCAKAKALLQKKPHLFNSLRPRASILTLKATVSSRYSLRSSSAYTHNNTALFFALLPAELRKRIYEYVVINMSRSDLVNGMGFLRVCAQMYRETAAMVAPMRDWLELSERYREEEVRGVTKWVRGVDGEWTDSGVPWAG